MWREFLTFLGCFIAGASAFIAVGIYVSNWAEEVQCRNTAAAMGVPYQYSISTPCLIKPEGKPWVPLRSYRVL
jgi:hypothetical protein